MRREVRYPFDATYSDGGSGGNSAHTSSSAGTSVASNVLEWNFRHWHKSSLVVTHVARDGGDGIIALGETSAIITLVDTVDPQLLERGVSRDGGNEESSRCKGRVQHGSQRGSVSDP